MTFLARLGPGIVFAAMAVGVSHLVQSTRAGADYGLSILGLLLVANLLKYPLFRFAIVYSATTGRTLLDGYRAIGAPAVGLLIVSVVIDMFIAASAVSLVTAGVVNSVFGTSAPTPLIVAGLGAAAFVVVIGSAYRLFERATIILVMTLSLLTVAAVMLVAPTAVQAGSQLLPSLPLTPEFLLFFVAMSGWMPNPPSASFFLSAWAAVRHEDATDGAAQYDRKSAIFDINLGYALSALIAVCFAILGAVLIFLPGVTLNALSAAAFANGFFDLFTRTFGGWVRPIVGVAAILVMFSTMLTLFDGAPRMMRQALGFGEASRLMLCVVFLAQLAGVLVIIQFFGSSFRSLIDFATSFSFATAPFIAFLNHRVMFSAEVPAELRPGPIMRVWSWVGGVSMVAFAFYFFFQAAFQ